MSWFKSRQDKTASSGTETKTEVADKPTNDLGTKSFADARRALRASIDLELEGRETTSHPASIDPLESSLDKKINKKDKPDLEVARGDINTDLISQEPEPEKNTTKPTSEETELPPLLDESMSQDIQNILGKIDQVLEEKEKQDALIAQQDVTPGDALKENLSQAAELVEDTPPPPAFKIDDAPDVGADKKQEKDLDDLPPPTGGHLSDPSLGKAKPIEAQLSKNLIELDEAKLPNMEEIQVDIVPEEEDKDAKDAGIDIPASSLLSEDAPSSDAAPSSNEAIPAMDDTKNFDLSLNPVETAEEKDDTTEETSSADPIETAISNATVTSQPLLNLPEGDGLEIRNLGKSYKKRPVLHDVSLTVKRGEAVGLLGPNGAGKTTCFYMVCGLIPADVGVISLDGQEITDLPMYRRARMGIGYLPQEASIFRGLTVEQNIRAVLEAVGGSRDERETMLESLMEEFSISHLRRSPSVALSGGERRRLEIARALATQPHFILLDEPLAGIDPIAVRDIRELVRHLKDRGLGVLITDHNVRETLGIVDRAYILHSGRVLMEGKPDEIIRNEEVKRVYLGDEFDR